MRVAGQCGRTNSELIGEEVFHGLLYVRPLRKMVNRVQAFMKIHVCRCSNDKKQDEEGPRRKVIRSWKN